MKSWTRRRAGTLLLVLAALLSGSACGGDDPKATDASATSVTRGGTTSTAADSDAATSSTATHDDEHEDDEHHEEGTTKPDFPVVEASQTVKVGMKDFAFVDVPASVTGPKVVFTATNAGPSEHELEILDSNGEAEGEIVPVAPGKSDTLAVELSPGTYTMQCILESGSKTHAELGMTQTFVVT